MSVFVDQSSGADTGNVTMDLFTISWNDGNLGQGTNTTVASGLGGVSSIPVAPVTYAGGVTTGMATASRLSQMVTTATGLNWADPIVITGLFGGIDPYSGEDITGNGLTYVDTNVTPNVIHIAYDTSQANGQGLALYDVGGHAIQTPNAVILYHEMSHAFHNALNQIPFPQSACPGNTSDEPAAEIDENVLRTQLGLCQRDVCNHNGGIGWGKACGGRATPTGPPLADGDAPDEDTGCFIVTAAAGSGQAPEILALRALRDGLAVRSAIAGALIGAVYDEYFRFSIGIAARIATANAAQRAVGDLVVSPLFAWFNLADQLTRDPADRAAVGKWLTMAGRARDTDGAVLFAPLLERAARGEIDPALLALAPELRHLAGLPFARWALLEPLAAMWRIPADSTGAEDGLIAEVAAWLAAAPIDRIETVRDPADDEIGALAHLLAFAPHARQRLGMRLAAAWPGKRDALCRHGFIS
ncbi:MAG: hypothetical protein P0Y59_20140 [Candidatus Sphingomonas phytovorans]|nr:hypothetical protein [Sphingomonas sp.]WEJ99220.1 MAG: hypothetical protein P0Y59_20140 [Sphingomonas sp.]